MALGNPLKYTGRRIVGTVKYIMQGPMYGLASGWLCPWRIWFDIKIN